ncbi:MAG: helix-turn-helix domain-containing protein [Nannocystaceae bacterium]|nr:helix-turn-helix domain-containing protein [Nannocystaceae bacterium]
MGGDPLGALDLVALREDAVSLALRGTAMAQLGEFASARTLLVRARDAGGPLAAARCVVALSEVEVALRELTTDIRPLEHALVELRRAGDEQNANLARLVLARRALLLGRLSEAVAYCGLDDAAGVPPRIRVLMELLLAEIEMRRTRASTARRALSRAAEALELAPVPALCTELEDGWRRLGQPVARLMRAGARTDVDLASVEDLNTQPLLVVDACRRVARTQECSVALSRRRVPFDLLQALAVSWPGSAPRDELIRSTFGARRIQDSDRVKLRVEIGRLRALVSAVAQVEPTVHGYMLRPHAEAVVVLSPPFDGAAASLRALLADGAAWSASALAAALGVSVRTAQRTLHELAEEALVLAVGSGRTTRWVLAPSMVFRTPLLLPRHSL